MTSSNVKLIVYPGGKWYLTSWLIPLFPRHERYIEVFGGSGTFLFKKRQSRVEVYNDINDDLYNFFKILRDKSNELIERVQYLPTSRSMFDEYAKKMKEKSWSDDIDRAIAVLYLSRFAFGGKWQCESPYYAIVHEIHTRREFSWSSTRKLLSGFARRFDKVVVEHLDYKDLIQKYDRDDVFFYLDPPYFDIDKSYYIENFKEKDHVELSSILKNIKGKFMLSYDSSQFILDLYKNFRILKKDFCNFITSKKNNNKREMRQEIVVLNYDPSVDKFNNNRSIQAKVI